MKIRLGFVSNSSSSSFCLVGTSTEWVIDELATKEGLDFEDGSAQLDYGACHGNNVIFVGYDEPEVVGIEIDALLEDHNLKQLRQYFQDLVLAKFQVEIPLTAIDLHYGEWGNG